MNQQGSRPWGLYGVCGLLAAVVAVAAFGAYSSWRVGKAGEDLYVQQVLAGALLVRASQGFGEYRTHVVGATMSAGSPESARLNVEQLEGLGRQVDEAIGANMGMRVDAAEQAALQSLIAQWNTYRGVTMQQVVPALASGDAAGARRALEGGAEPAYAQASRDINALLVASDEAALVPFVGVVKFAGMNRYVMLGTLAVVVLLCAPTTYWFARRRTPSAVAVEPAVSEMRKAA